MFNSTDTIVAVATPAGHGGIGIVRLSGPEAFGIAHNLIGSASLRPWRVKHAQIRDKSGCVLDDVLVTAFKGPKSYTAEDVVEISGHGSPVLLAAIVEAAIALGARLAEPGEFTRRAFINGRIDLTQAEAIRDLIEAQTLYQAQTAARQMYGSVSTQLRPVKELLKELIAGMEAGIDFADDDVMVMESSEIERYLADICSTVQPMLASFRSGRLVSAGLQLALVGRPNVGKSSLFNRLVQTDRAIVTAHPGTTRDSISESANLDGIPLRFVDTAGIRESADEVERLGIERSRSALADADVVLAIFDGSQPMTEDDVRVIGLTAEKPNVLFAINKSDLPQKLTAADLDHVSVGIGRQNVRICTVSAVSGAGLEELRCTVKSLALPDLAAGGEFITNARHAQHLGECQAALSKALEACSRRLPHEVILIDLYDALRSLGAITGETTIEDILGVIFSRFCIGK
jgi:tRNA modification GTPase